MKHATKWNCKYLATWCPTHCQCQSSITFMFCANAQNSAGWQVICHHWNQHVEYSTRFLMLHGWKNVLKTHLFDRSCNTLWRCFWGTMCSAHSLTYLFDNRTNQIIPGKWPEVRQWRYPEESILWESFDQQRTCVPRHGLCSNASPTCWSCRRTQSQTSRSTHRHHTAALNCYKRTWKPARISDASMWHVMNNLRIVEWISAFKPRNNKHLVTAGVDNNSLLAD